MSRIKISIQYKFHPIEGSVTDGPQFSGKYISLEFANGIVPYFVIREKNEKQLSFCYPYKNYSEIPHWFGQELFILMKFVSNQDIVREAAEHIVNNYLTFCIYHNKEFHDLVKDQFPVYIGWFDTINKPILDKIYQS
jgi:hypothetical protein